MEEFSIGANQIGAEQLLPFLKHLKVWRWSRPSALKRWRKKVALDFEEKGRPGKIELLTALTEALFGAKNKSCSASLEKVAEKTKRGFGSVDHLSCCHGGHKPVEQFVRWGHFKGDHCHMPSAPPNWSIWSRSLYTPRQCYLSDESWDGQCVSGGCVTFCDGRGGFKLELLVAGHGQTAWSHSLMMIHA